MKWRIKELNYNDGTTGYQIQSSWLGLFWEDYTPWPSLIVEIEKNKIKGYHEKLESAVEDLNRLQRISDKKVINSKYIMRGNVEYNNQKWVNYYGDPERVSAEGWVVVHTEYGMLVLTQQMGDEAYHPVCLSDLEVADF